MREGSHSQPNCQFTPKKQIFAVSTDTFQLHKKISASKVAEEYTKARSKTVLVL